MADDDVVLSRKGSSVIALGVRVALPQRARGPGAGADGRCTLVVVLRCEECWCESEAAPGWIAMLAHDPEEDLEPTVVTYCPPCAAREFGFESRVHYT